MDQREPPRTSSTEGWPRDIDGHTDGAAGPVSDARSPRRVYRLTLPGPVRQPNRLGWNVLGAIGLVVLLATACHWAVGYLHEHASYQRSFRQIQLVPPVPAWFRGGSARFLDEVAAASGMPGEFSTLDGDLAARLAVAFKLHPWVKNVERVEVRGGPEVVVHLVYRKPIAVAKFKTPSVPSYAVDADATLLPAVDYLPDAKQPRIELHGFDPPVSPKYGATWKRLALKTDLPETDPRVLDALAIVSIPASLPTPEFLTRAKIDFLAVHLPEEGPLFVQVLRNLMFRWTATGQGESESPKARWAEIAAWVRAHSTEIERPLWYSLDFTPEGARINEVHVPNEPVGGGEPRPSRATSRFLIAPESRRR